MSSLEGLRVLIVEDEAMIAMLAEDMLDMAGCQVAGVAASLDAGREAVARDDHDLVLLDVNLNGEHSTPLADQLKERGTPFIFTTGYGADGVDAAHTDVPVLAKPYVLTDLERAIGERMAQAGTSSITSTSDSNRG